jgi:hypothetical protein
MSQLPSMSFDVFMAFCFNIDIDIDIAKVLYSQQKSLAVHAVKLLFQLAEIMSSITTIMHD